MAKHRLNTQSNIGRSVRGAVAVTAVAAGAMALTAGPAAADTITVDGIGSFEVPAGIALPDLSAFPGVVQGLPAFSIDELTQSSPLSQGGVGQRALAAADSKVGSPYVWGATGPDAFDCSGLVQWAYDQVGVALPRTSGQMAGFGTPVAERDLQVGDIIVSYGGGHVALYAGNDQILHASTSGTPVKYAPLDRSGIESIRRA
ncbi:C40 family peptidase [Tomitella biformata]|uniref:C40 family peptidase n=1 Tax=Tomitella biformata TaxID=630403 RepID=UPI0004B7CF8F|nr:C40 family peptidase [Tomitella biformata]